MPLTVDKFFTFDPVELAQIAEARQAAYAQADPFPNITMDDFLPAGVLEPVLDEFPGRDDIDWRGFDRAQEKKFIIRDENQMGPYTRHLLSQLNSSTFIHFLEKLTGIRGLIPDHHFLGGGLHEVQPGGFLKIHADFNWHEDLRLDRRVNLLLYLNKDWQESYGGHLEFWDKSMTRCGRRILPVFNRCAIFSTTSTSYHGHPDPLKCPRGMSRRAINLYYYSNGRPEEERHTSHSTLFQSRPGEKMRSSTKQIIKGLTPPFLLEGASRLRQKIFKGRKH